MFFYLAKIIPMFFYPLPFFIIISWLAVFRLKKSRFRALYTLLLAGLTLISTGAVANFFLLSLEERYPTRSIGKLPRADAVIVLSGMVHPLTGRKERPEFTSAADRILLGEEMLKERRAPVLLISGGSGFLLQKGEPEALTLRRWLLKRGADPSRVLAESKSRNTAENARESVKIARARGWKRAFLVTSAFHMHRSLLCFKKAGLEVIPVPVDYRGFAELPGPEAFVPSSAGLMMSVMTLKEYLGLLAYRLKGYL